MKRMWIIAVIAVIAMVILNLSVKTGVEPDATYPFVNRYIWN